MALDDYELASDELHALMHRVIAEKRPDLLNYNIKLLIRVKRKTSKGQPVLGMAKVFPSEHAIYHNYHAQIWLDKKFIDANRQSTEALIYHELCHLQAIEGREGLTTVDHDFSGFFSELRHYGDWLGIAHQINAIQLEMQFEDCEENLVSNYGRNI